MKIIIFAIIFTSISFTQQYMHMAGVDIELGMEKDALQNLIDFNTYLQLEDNEGNIFLSHRKSDQPIGIINFKNNQVYKIQKDWGTSLQSNVGKVFKILWNIFKQYGDETEMLKVTPLEIFKPSSRQHSLNFYLDENRYIEILIQHRVIIFEVLESADLE